MEKVNTIQLSTEEATKLYREKNFNAIKSLLKNEKSFLTSEDRVRLQSVLNGKIDQGEVPSGGPFDQNSVYKESSTPLEKEVATKALKQSK